MKAKKFPRLMWIVLLMSITILCTYAIAKIGLVPMFSDPIKAPSVLIPLLSVVGGYFCINRILED